MSREPKTLPTLASVEDFLAAVEPAPRQADARAVCALMQRLTGDPPVMWGPAIVGFGSRRFRNPGGSEGDILRIGFSPRKAALTLYILKDDDARQADLLTRLGKHTKGRSCLYIKRLSDVDEGVLEDLVAAALT
jgi:hypothetical protein